MNKVKLNRYLKGAFFILASSTIVTVLHMSNNNFDLALTNIFMKRIPILVAYSMVIVGLIMAIIILLLNNVWLGILTSIMSGFILALANYIKIRMRLEPVFPDELTFIMSARDLFEMVELKMVIGMILFFGLMIGIMIVVVKVETKLVGKSFSFKLNRKNIILNSIAIITLVVCLVNIGNYHGNDKVRTFLHDNGFNTYRFEQLKSYKVNGFVIGFIYNMPGEIMDEPLNYSQAIIDDLMIRNSNYRDALNKDRPNDTFEDVSVVYILSETLSNPNRVEGIQLNENPIPYISNPSDKNASGLMLVPTYGGGTANTEFEILTGMSVSVLRDNMKMPYQNFITKFQKFPNIISDFDEGSKAVSIHPFNSRMFKRESVYKTFGFDHTIFEDTMKHTDRIIPDGYISDVSAYQEVLDQLTSPNQSIFINLVTMQNHAQYEHTYPGNTFVNLINTDEKFNGIVSTYAQGLKYTDDATKQFIEDVSKLDRKVIVVIYGDHLPGIYEGKAEGFDRFKTDFFVYANFTGAKLEDRELTSTTQVGALVKELTGVKASPLESINTELHDHILGRKSGQYLTNDHRYLTYDQLDEKTQQLIDDYYLLQYDIISGKQYSEKE